MYDEVENATCMWPIAWQFLKGDVASLDFSSHHVSINHADIKGKVLN